MTDDGEKVLNGRCSMFNTPQLLACEVCDQCNTHVVGANLCCLLTRDEKPRERTRAPGTPGTAGRWLLSVSSKQEAVP